MQIKHEIADQCLASTRRELESKSGSEFDECYVGMQVGAHMKMADALTVLERHASPELQPVLRKGLETVRTHLDHAKKVKKSLDEGGERTARSKDSSSSK
jgi:predicted outer membrane protein